ncbi:MAG: AAA family ATPase, partial [Rhodocyclaceae bacterium]|nr:AAA family ATPase [Rhodocyclaceae bacterium]
MNKRKVPVSDALRSFWPLIKVTFYVDRSQNNWRRGRLAAVLVLLNVLLFGGGGMFLAGMFGGLNAVLMAMGFVMGATGLIYLKLLKEGNIMISVFDLVDDRSKLEAFFAAEKLNAVVQVIPAIKSEVIGQDFVVEDVVRTLNRRTQLKRSNKPLGVFMFVGATGSGKTELAKSIAKHVFDGRLVRFDMNEFTDASSAQRLIGSPPGYIGSEHGGQLTQAIKRMGSGVILFAEIEKADPAVYKMIMGLMDEGRITEQSTGETMDAKNFVIIMTSNAAHRELAEIAGRINDPEERRRAVKD